MPGLAAALEYRSISAPKAVLYDAPSSQAKKLFVVGQGYPVEVIVNLGGWIKVRDHFGTLSWVEAKDLDTKRTLIVTRNTAELKESADAAGKVIARVDKDVLLEMVEPPSVGTAGSNWIKVRHRDGLTAYIQATAVWGY
ncbi:MAG TPA: SH3 domain-containing protein [Methylophilaceae bacterium]|nr:SH3 domain-containing protein [Methylophilaceae bacterium]